VRVETLPFEALSRFLPPLLLDYLSGKAPVKGLLTGDFRSIDSIGDRAREVFRPIPADVKGRWEDSLKSFAAPAKVMGGLERLAAGASCVVTGQQPGLFGGPVYNLYKAATAVKLAQLVERHTHMPCVPIFWNHSDDHSLAEFSSFGFPAEEGVAELSLTVDETPVPAYLYDARWVYPALLDRLARVEGLPQGLVDLLRSCYQDTPAAGFTRLLLSCFGAHGLVPLEPRILDGETTKKLYARVLAKPSEVRAAMEQGAAAVRAAGHEPVLTGSHGTGVFAIREGLRQKIESSNGALTLAGEKVKAWDLISAGTRLSPQVFLRPIVQDAVLPTCAYVGGPHELTYFAELRPLYEHLQIAMPILVPRLSATLLDPPTARAIEKLGMEPTRLFLKRDDVHAEVIRAARGNVLTRIDELTASALKGLDEVAPGILEVDKNLESALQKTRTNVEHSLQALQARIVKAVQDREEVQASRLAKALAFVRPGGDLQERRFGMAAMLSLAGEGFVSKLISALDPLEPGHRLIHLPEELQLI